MMGVCSLIRGEEGRGGLILPCLTGTFNPVPSLARCAAAKGWLSNQPHKSKLPFPSARKSYATSALGQRSAFGSGDNLTVKLLHRIFLFSLELHEFDYKTDNEVGLLEPTSKFWTYNQIEDQCNFENLSFKQTPLSTDYRHVSVFDQFLINGQV